MARIIFSLTVAFGLIASFFPTKADACACGCGVFDVGTSSMLPTDTGGMVSFQYYYMNQNDNWHSNSSAPAANNDDKDIRTHFFTAGGRYMFNRSWGAEIEIPFWSRHFKTTDDSGNVVSFDHFALGDMKIKGIYSGFSENMSTGVTLGVKVPTGDHTYANFDRDTEIGTGSTDISVGAYHMGNVSGAWNWFANGEWNQPVLTQGGYRPGSELNAASGIYYDGWRIGSVKVAPIGQILGSLRLHDSGSAAMPDDSGYERLLVSPGVEVAMNGFRIYSDVGIPFFQHVRGNQLVAPILFKVSVSQNF